MSVAVSEMREGEDMNKLVYLAYSNPRATAEREPPGRDVLSCAFCRNKTYIIMCTEHWPICKCAVCGSHIGAIGWADEPLEQKCGKETESPPPYRTPTNDDPAGPYDL